MLSTFVADDILKLIFFFFKKIRLTFYVYCLLLKDTLTVHNGVRGTPHFKTLKENSCVYSHPTPPNFNGESVHFFFHIF